MIPLGEARAYVLAGCPPLHPSAVRLADALGCVASVSVRAEEAIPASDNSGMDGFAVRAADTTGAPVTLDVVGTLAAGAPPEVHVGAGQAVRIMTGAALPPGADAVVMVESTRPSPDGHGVSIEVAVRPGTALRRAGDDLAVGDVVLEPGTVLGPGHLGVLASLGIRRAPVRRRLRVGVLSTGDELVEGPEALRPGQVRDANRPTLLALVTSSGFEGIDLGLVADDEALITAAIEGGVERCDAVITSGGVSMGDFDYVKVVLDRMGDMRWMQVAVRPAKPLAFGVVGGTPVFGLPGNPVSSMVSFELFARPGLRQMMGFPDLDRPSVMARAEHVFDRQADGKTHFVRALTTLAEDGRRSVRSAGGQGSHQLHAMAGADALVVLPNGPGVEEGASVRALLLS